MGQELHRRLSKQVDVVTGNDLHPDDLHTAAATTAQLATSHALRRLEAGLHVFAPVYDARDVSRLTTELAWAGTVLDEVRDRAELAGRLRRRLGDVVDDEEVRRAVADHLDRALTIEGAMRLARLGEAMRSERYRQLVARLDRWRRAPAFTRRADAPLATLDTYLRKSAREFEQLLEPALVNGGHEDLQRVRHAAERVRLAAEVSAHPAGRKAAKRVKQVARVEALLVEHAASVRTTTFLQRVGPVEGSDGQHHSFALGRWYELERRRSKALLDQLKQERG